MRKKNRRPVPGSTPSTAHPISALPDIASAVDHHLSDVTEELATLRKACDNPYLLDDTTVQGAIRVHKRMLVETAALLDVTLVRWRKEALTDAQREEVERVHAQVLRLRTACREILDVASTLARNTVDQVLSMSDAEVGLAYLMGQLGTMGVGRGSESNPDPVPAEAWTPASSERDGTGILQTPDSDAKTCP